MKIGSLFTGYGGLDMAVEGVFDAETVWVSDIKPAAAKLLSHRRPGIPNLGDITKIDWSQVEPVDIITGGFPCTDVSAAGRRAGLIRYGDQSTRSGLWSEMCRAVDQLRPSLMVAENVRGLFSAKADCSVEFCAWCVGDGSAFDMRAFDAVLGDLADIGYDAAWQGLRAADVGLCHGRWRVFIVAWPSDSDPARFKGNGAIASPPEVAGVGCDRPSFADADSLGLQWGGRTWDRRPGFADGDSEAGLKLLPTPQASDTSKHAGQPRHKRAGRGHSTRIADVVECDLKLLPTPAVARFPANVSVAPGSPIRHSIHAIDKLLPTPRESDGAKGGPNQRGSSGDLMLPSAVMRFGEYAPAVQRHADAIGRPAPSPTEIGSKGGERLSPSFTEWMMGLPVGWITDVPGLSRNEQLSLCGDGVVPQQASAALEYLLEAAA